MTNNELIELVHLLLMCGIKDKIALESGNLTNEEWLRMMSLIDKYQSEKSDPEAESESSDLISRSALKKAIKSYADDQYAENEYLGECSIMNIIDNAPTVEYTFEEAFQKTVCDNKLYCPARPKGMWKEMGYETGALGITYRQTQCSNCGWEHALPMWWNFCPNCGADMQRGYTRSTDSTNE